MAGKVKATAIRSLIMKYTKTIRQSSAVLNNRWGSRVDVGLHVREGWVLPENSPEALRSAYRNLLGLELVAYEARQGLLKLVRDVHGPEVLTYMIGERDWRDIPGVEGQR